MQDDAVLFTFQTVDTNVDTFDQVQVRLKKGGDPRWRGPCLILLARVEQPGVGIVNFTFGVPEGTNVGQVIWGTTTQVWPPKNGTDRMKAVADIRRVIRTCLETFPGMGLDPVVANSAEDLGTIYEVTGTLPSASHRAKLRSKGKKRREKARRTSSAPQGIKASALGFSKFPG